MLSERAQEILSELETAADHRAAEAVLIQLEPFAEELAEQDAALGEMFDELATEATEAGDHAAAARLQAKAVAHGTRDQAGARATLGWCEISNGAVDDGLATFAALLAERPSDSRARTTYGLALEDVDEAAAHDAYDDAITVARRERIGGRTLLDAQIQREDLRRRMGLPFDRDDREVIAHRAGLAETPGRADAPYVLLWFPGGEASKAAALWPSLSLYGVGDPTYREEAQMMLAVRADLDGKNPVVMHATVQDLIDRDLAPRLDGPTDDEQARMSAWVDSADLIAWPPGRNDPCWCGEATKYKRCCGRWS